MTLNQHKRFVLAAAVAVLLCPLMATADMVNGGFEDMLNGWTTTGLVVPTMSEFERGITGAPDWTPTEGFLFAALFSADGFGSMQATMEQTFEGHAGTALSFNYFFDFGDESPYMDSARSELIGPSGTATLFEYNEGAGLILGDYENVGWTQLGHNILEDGMYTLRFTITDYDGTFESMMGVDNVIPAPAALLLGAMGLGMVGWIKRRVG